MEITALIISVLAGIFIGLPTGPARFFVADTYLNKGRKSALKVYLGLFVAIIIYAGIAFLAAGFFSRHPTVEKYSYILGSVLVISWGIFMIFKGRKNNNAPIEIGVDGDFKKGFFTGLSSPVTPFIYLALIQILKLNTGSTSVTGIWIYLLIFEAMSFLTTFLISYYLHKNQREMKSNWKRAKLIMGFFLILIGSYNLFQLIEFQKGFHIQNSENLLEQHLDG